MREGREGAYDEQTGDLDVVRDGRALHSENDALERGGRVPRPEPCKAAREGCVAVVRLRNAHLEARRGRVREDAREHVLGGVARGVRDGHARDLARQRERVERAGGRRAHRDERGPWARAGVRTDEGVPLVLGVLAQAVFVGARGERVAEVEVACASKGEVRQVREGVREIEHDVLGGGELDRELADVGEGDVRTCPAADGDVQFDEGGGERLQKGERVWDLVPPTRSEDEFAERGSREFEVAVPPRPRHHRHP